MKRSALPLLLLVLLAPLARADYRHVVLFKFKDDATDGQIRRIEQAFAELPKKIDTITGLEWGTNVSPENLDQGFTHCFLVSFADKKGLEAYLPHPAHKEFGQQLRPVLDKVLVIDFVPGGAAQAGAPPQ